MSSNLWNRFCNFYQHYPEVGFSLDVSRMRFPDEIFSTLAGPIQKAFQGMSELEQGAIANPDEQRMVGHYWLRDATLAPTSELRLAIQQNLTAIKEFASAVHSGKILSGSGSKFTHVLVIGIGGSALGPQLVQDALGSKADQLALEFCDNTDPDGIDRALARLGQALSTTMVIVISKSGGTVETKNAQLEVAARFAARSLAFAKNAVAVTCEGSKLDLLATEGKWLARFPMWDWVGGRTSLFSGVGLLPAALQGLDIDNFIDGARRMDSVTRQNTDPRSNPAMLIALMWHHAGQGRGAKDMVVLPYKDRLVLMSKYLQQLVMESLGKELDLDGNIVNQGIAVYGNKGSTDQHAYIQQLRDGVNNFFVTFIEVLKDRTAGSTELGKALEVAPLTTSGDYLSGFYLGTREALYGNNRDSLTITLEALTPASLGALISLFERAVGYYASIVNVNAYHQPGVEAGKKAAEKIIDLQRKILTGLSARKDQYLTVAELVQSIDCQGDEESVYKIAEHLASNERLKRLSAERHPAKVSYSLV